ELNAVAPDTPVFLLHLYDRAVLNAAALRAVGYTKDTPNPPGGEIVLGADGTPTGLLLAKPNAGILYATLAKGPKLPFDYQLNSTRHFMRELNRLGVTGAIDAGGGMCGTVLALGLRREHEAARVRHACWRRGGVGHLAARRRGAGGADHWRAAHHLSQL